MKKPAYTEADIQARSTPKSYERGLQYCHSGAVRRIVRRGDQVLARVSGTDYRPYRVQVFLENDFLVDARCNCPYDWGGWCKHIIAVLIAMLEKPGRVHERVTIESLIDELDEDQFRAMILDLTERYPRLTAKIEAWVKLNTT